MEHILEIGTIEISRKQQIRWREGKLAGEWADRFPDLFDEDDRRLAVSQGHLGFHFAEWLAAIVLNAATGYHSLVGKYEFESHLRKREIIRALVQPDLIEALSDRSTHGQVQSPDLLMYAPDMSDWFFCEVKGPRDRLRPDQIAKFETLAAVGGRPVRVLRMNWAAE